MRGVFPAKRPCMSGFAVPSPEAMSTQKRMVAQERVFFHMFYSLSSSSFSYQAEATGTDGGKIQPQSRIGATYVPPLPICSASAADIRRAQCVPPATSDLQRLRRGGDPAVRNAPSAKKSASMLETQDCSMHGSATSLHRQVAKSAPSRAAGRRGGGRVATIPRQATGRFYPA